MAFRTVSVEEAPSKNVTNPTNGPNRWKWLGHLFLRSPFSMPGLGRMVEILRPEKKNELNQRSCLSGKIERKRRLDPCPE